MADSTPLDPPGVTAANRSPVDDQAMLQRLGVIFMEAMVMLQAGGVARGMELLQLIVRREPRLPEPHLELARIHYDAGRLDEAEVEAREGMAHLQRGGQWVDEISEDELQSLAHGLLGEILRARLDTDAVVFGGESLYRALLDDSRFHFKEATRLDPRNDHAGHHAFFLGLDDLQDGDNE